MATQSAPRRVTFIVNDDDEKFIIVIPEEIITADQLKNVARNFQRVADEDCSIVYDSETRTFRLSQMADGEALEAPRYTLVGHAKAVEDSGDISANATKSHRIPRPPNAWIIYRSQKSKQIRKELPQATAGYISTVVSRMWKLETRETRLLFNAKAVEAQKIHRQMYPHYRYNAKGRKATSNAVVEALDQHF